MKTKRKYCQICGSRVNSLSIIEGVYAENSCDDPTCPTHGSETYDEYSGLTVFTPGDYDDDY